MKPEVKTYLKSIVFGLVLLTIALSLIFSIGILSDNVLSISYQEKDQKETLQEVLSTIPDEEAEEYKLTPEEEERLSQLQKKMEQPKRKVIYATSKKDQEYFQDSIERTTNPEKYKSKVLRSNFISLIIFPLLTIFFLSFFAYRLIKSNLLENIPTFFNDNLFLVHLIFFTFGFFLFKQEVLVRNVDKSFKEIGQGLVILSVLALFVTIPLKISYQRIAKTKS